MTSILDNLDNLELYERMVTIRLLEERLQAMCDRGEAGDLHFNRGQEAIAVGVCATLRHTDHIVTHHRTIAHQIAKGAALYPLIAELLGRRTGTNAGKAGEMHISDSNIRHDFSFQLVGTCIPVAAGLAWALKYHHKKDEVVAVFFGDAASSNGQFHEGLNIAAIKKVPLLLICENNHLAGNIRPEHYTPVGTVAQRMRAYGINSPYGDGASTVDGNDISEVIHAAQVALDMIREDSGPCFVEYDTTRTCWHKQGQRDIRSADELADLATRDPLLAIEKNITPTEKSKIFARTNARLDEAFSKALSDPAAEVQLD